MFMDSKESIEAATSKAIDYINKDVVNRKDCEMLILTMIKAAYIKGREDVHTGSSNDILEMLPQYVMPF